MHARFLERRDLIVRLLNDVPGITCKSPGRRVLRMAQRHRGVPARRRRGLGGVPQAAAARSGHRRARRHPFRPPRAGRRTAHPLFVRGVECGDRERRRAARRVRAPAHGVAAGVDMAIDDNRRRARRCSRACAPRSARWPRRRGARGGARVHRGARARARGPRCRATLSQRFLQRATDMASTVERVAGVRRCPAAVARYSLRSMERRRWGERSLARACAGRNSRHSAGATRVWRSNRGRRVGHDALGITGCFCAIAETGTLVFVTGAETPTATFLLPETHVAIVRADQIVAAMEDAFARIRARARRDAASGEPRLGPFTYRRHRADDRARRARAAPAAYRAGRVIRSRADSLASLARYFARMGSSQAGLGRPCAGLPATTPSVREFAQHRLDGAAVRQERVDARRIEVLAALASSGTRCLRRPATRACRGAR